MKKRFVCALLTLVLLVGLVPVTASAADHSVSGSAVTVLKQLTPIKYNSASQIQCYHVKGLEFRTGYGTVCGEKHHFDTDGKPIDYKTTLGEAYTDKKDLNKHVITLAQADATLRLRLTEVDKKINSFASQNGLSLSQGQHDALVIFTYDAGEAWLSGTGNLRDVVINVVKGKAGTNELLNAMSLWDSSVTSTNVIGRRKIEANMFMNGTYTNTIPANYDYVIYNANGGAIPQKNQTDGTYKAYFDSSVSVEHMATPTNYGQIFLGWYLKESADYKWTPKLNKYCADTTLFALWQNDYKVNSAVKVNYLLSTSHLASRTLYEAPLTKDLKAIKDSKGKAISVASDIQAKKDFIAEDGTRWSNVTAKDADGNSVSGWVKVGTPKSVTSDGQMVDFEVTVTVTSAYVNSRAYASITSPKNGSYSQGAQLLIIREEDGFGQVGVKQSDGTVKAVGWVFLAYTNWDEVRGNATSGSAANNTVAIATATVTYPGYLNVRSEAGTDGKIVGALAKNEMVNLYEIKTVNGHRWGRCSSGWLCLSYTSVSMLTSESKVSDTGALAYAFTAKTSDANERVVRVAPGVKSDPYKYKTYEKNAKGEYEEVEKQGAKIPKNTEITLTNLTIADDAYWAKATWKNAELDKKGKDVKVTRSGWIKISDTFTVTNPPELKHEIDTTNPYVELDPVMFTVVCDTVNVRNGAGDGAALAFTLDKGVEMEVNGIKMVGENLWGHLTRITPVDSDKIDENKEAGTKDSDKKYNDGWINLATKYVKRSSQVTIDKESDHDTGLIATVTGTDTVKVRRTGALYGAVIGSLDRGTTVQVWEINDNWYKIDTNKNGKYDYEGDGWVYGAYLDVREGSLSGDKTVTDSNGNTYNTDGSGTGIIANTYSGVNVRQGAGIGYAPVGKLLPGTQVQILEVKQGGAAKWGRTAQGWVCMDYVSMVSYNPSKNPTPEKGTPVADLGSIEKTTTTAVYTGSTDKACKIFKEPIAYSIPDELTGSEYTDEQKEARKAEIDTIKALIADNTVKELAAGQNVTIHELAAVTQTVKSDRKETENKDGDDVVISSEDKVTTITTTTFWARVNGGWIQNPETNLNLDALDEKVHTVTGSDTLKVRKGPSQDTDKVDELEKGDQVKVTALQIKQDKVWGRIETEEGTGWIRLDYTSEGAYYVNETPAATTPSGPIMGSTGNTGTGGFVTNTSGYKYKGKVIRANEVNVRAQASTASTATTKLKNGAGLVIYETTISENMAWGRCDAGWIYLYYVDLEPCVAGAVDARVVYNDNTIAYSDVNCTTATGTYQRMSVVDIYEIVGKMAKTDLGWINTDNLL